METSNAPHQLIQVADRIRASNDHMLFSTPRELLGWFGQYRRTWRQVRKINGALRALELVTIPDFEGVGFDDPIVIRLHSDDDTIGSPTISQDLTPTALNETQVASSEPNVEPVLVSQSTPADPVHRVARFLPPAGTLVMAKRDYELQSAVTQMLLHDFSQLPVMQSPRNVDGMISWRSIGQRRAMGREPQFVRDCIEQHFEVKADDSIFDAIRVIQEHECVLVRSVDNQIVGILTATDISGSFEQLSRPFLLLSYIENNLRALIQPRFSIDELQSAKDPDDADRLITDVSDMTFGEYIRLLENPNKWSKLCIGIERGLFVTHLNEVREIRNDVMHFNPEGIEDKDMEALRRFNSFLQSIVSLLPNGSVEGTS